MDWNLQKNTIAEKTLNTISDIQSAYLREHGSMDGWSKVLFEVYYLNCDTEVKHLLKKYNLTLHEDTFFYGVTRGILMIQHEINYYFEEMHGESLEYHIKDKKFQVLFSDIYEYLINGMEGDFYGD